MPDRTAVDLKQLEDRYALLFARIEAGRQAWLSAYPWTLPPSSLIYRVVRDQGFAAADDWMTELEEVIREAVAAAARGEDVATYAQHFDRIAMARPR